MAQASRPTKPAKSKNQTLTFMVVPRSGKVLSFNVATLTLKRVAAALVAVLALSGLFAMQYGLMARKVNELVELRRVNGEQKLQIEAINKELETMRDDIDTVRDLEQKVRDLLSSERDVLSKRYSAAAQLVTDPAQYRMALSTVVSRSSRDLRSGELDFSLAQPASLDMLHRDVKTSLVQAMSDLTSTSASLQEAVAEARALPSLMPVIGRVTSTFGSRRSPFGGRSTEFHEGLDIAANYGTSVTAAGDGVVTFAGYKAGYGLTVIIDHKNGLISMYGHLSRTKVTKGKVVTRGTSIGLVGSTGRATGPHLHFEVSKNGKLVDPKLYTQ